MIDHPQGGRMFVAPRRAAQLAGGTASHEYGELDTATFIDEMHQPGAVDAIVFGGGTRSTVFFTGATPRRFFMASPVHSTLSIESDEWETQEPPLQVATEISGSHRRLANEALAYPHYSVVEVRLPSDPED
jgi:hypothetical protein